MTELTLEQQFSIAELQLNLERMSSDQLREFSLLIYRQMLLQRNAAAELFKQQWLII